MSAVLAGSVLSWTGNFDSYSFYNQTSNDCTNNVASQLRNKYNLIVTRVADGIGSADFQPGSITLEVRTDQDRGNGSDGVADIKGNIDDEFALQGNAATSSTIQVTSTPGQAAAPVSVPGGADYSACTGVLDTVQNILPTWLGGSPVTAKQQACYTKQNQAQIGSVATNAAQYYGVDSTTAQVAAKTAAEQQQLSATDTAILTDKARADAAKADEAQKNKLLMYGAIAIGIVLVVILLPYTR